MILIFGGTARGANKMAINISIFLISTIKRDKRNEM